MSDRAKQHNCADTCYTSVMIWKTITGYPDYEVSDTGQVRSKSRKTRWAHHGKSGLSQRKTKIIKQIPRRESQHLEYMQVSLYTNGIQKSINVHRIVAKEFVPNPDNKPQVNHKDGNGTNNHKNNLEWVTQSENTLHAYRVLGRRPSAEGKFGKEHPTSKKVIQMDIEGNTIKEWGCAFDAVREAGFDSGGISRAARGENKTHKGYRWKYE